MMINDSKIIFCKNMIKWKESSHTWHLHLYRFVFFVWLLTISESLLPLLALESNCFLGSSLFPLEFCHIFAKVGLPRPCGLSRPSPLALEALFEEDGLQRDGSKSCPVFGCPTRFMDDFWKQWYLIPSLGNYSYPFATYFWDDFPFPKVGYVHRSLEGVFFPLWTWVNSDVCFTGESFQHDLNSRRQRSPRQPMAVIQLRSLFHEQQQYVGVSHPGGTCKIWCYETRNAADLEAATKTDWKKNESRVSLALPPMKTSTCVENWWLEDEIYLEMATF